MFLNVRKMLQELNIPFVESGVNWQAGWINIRCPKCDDTSYHGGFLLTKPHYHCWRCGHHRVHSVIASCLGISMPQAFKLIKQFGTYVQPTSADTPQKKGTALKTTLPFGTQPLKKYHKKYLLERNFDPTHLEKVWDLQGTGHLGDYKFRIIAPIFYNKKLVSYQGRDITNQSELRYKDCQIKNEVIHHKHILYGIDQVEKRRCVIVEGITDVWRLGPGAISPFGTGFTLEQCLLLAQRIDFAAILFDRSHAATQKADKLSITLQSFGVQTDEYELDHQYEDPAELPESEAKSFMSNIL